MYRTALEQLQNGKRKSGGNRLLSAERVRGGTWLMKEFGKCAYEKTVYINFDSNSIGEKRERNR